MSVQSISGPRLNTNSQVQSNQMVSSKKFCDDSNDSEQVKRKHLSALASAMANLELSFEFGTSSSSRSSGDTYGDSIRLRRPIKPRKICDDSEQVRSR